MENFVTQSNIKWEQRSGRVKHMSSKSYDVTISGVMEIKLRPLATTQVGTTNLKP